MVKIKAVLLSESEEKELRDAHSRSESAETTVEELLAANRNQTVAVLRQLKPLAKLEDIEDVVNFVDAIKKFIDSDEPELTDDEVKSVKLAFKNAVASKEINGFAYDRIVEIYKTFK